ncbi:MAG: hypothetical protein RLZZ505_459 [Verrucomicrobiota bacterium]
MPTLAEDRKMKDLISRVGEDVSQLRSDIRSLFTHTGRHALPDSARELREQARERLMAGGTYLRQHPGQSSIGILGGLFILGAVGAGIYYLCKSDCCGNLCNRDEDYTEEDERDLG